MSKNEGQMFKTRDEWIKKGANPIYPHFQKFNHYLPVLKDTIKVGQFYLFFKSGLMINILLLIVIEIERRR